MISSLALVVFRHNGQNYAIEAQSVLRQGQVNPRDDAPMTCFSELLPANAQAPGGDELQWLEIASRSTPPWRLALNAAAQLIELPVDNIFPLPELLRSRRTFAALQAIAWHRQELVALLNVDALFQLQQNKHGTLR